MLSMPGQRTVDTGVTPREILMSSEGLIHAAGPVVIDSAVAIDGANTSRTDELLAGCLMAQNTASGKWAPLKRTTVASTAGGAVTTCVLVSSRFFKVGDVLDINGDAITITAINYATNAITWVGAATVVAAEEVITTGAAGAGYETAKGVLKESVRLLSGVLYDVTLYDKPGVIAIGGYFNQDNILGDLTAARADTAARLDSCRWSDQQQNL